MFCIAKMSQVTTTMDHDILTNNWMLASLVSFSFSSVSREADQNVSCDSV